ncbi:MAG: orotidine-5'-phosphate decarboxylase, partial [Acidobacteria bacterium]
AAAESLAREARRGGRKRPRLLAVTALTSLGDLDLASIGLLGPAEELVVRLAALARRAGCDGVVCSPREASLVRARCGAEFFIVTPGIRPAFAPGAGAGEDQKRTSTPAEALSAGADLIVIGRPVTGARDPAAAVERILDEIAGSAVRMP